MFLKTVFIYILLVNFISVIVCAFDKRAAIRKKRRVSEKALFLLVLIGGGPGMHITMRRIRHKTLHKRFMWGIPAIIFLQILCVYCVMYLTK